MPILFMLRKKFSLEIFAVSQIHIRVNAQIRKFTNACRIYWQICKVKCAILQMLSVTNSGNFVLNFQLNFSKS